jgi:hypothetical protein
MDETQCSKIQSISLALNRLNMINQLSYDKEYNEICVLMKKYIDTHCKHQIVQDSIDISPDCSKTIQYCLVCMTSF